MMEPDKWKKKKKIRIYLACAIGAAVIITFSWSYINYTFSETGFFPVNQTKDNQTILQNQTNNTAQNEPPLSTMNVYMGKEGSKKITDEAQIFGKIEALYNQSNSYTIYLTNAQSVDFVTDSPSLLLNESNIGKNVIIHQIQETDECVYKQLTFGNGTSVFGKDAITKILQSPSLGIIEIKHQLSREPENIIYGTPYTLINLIDGSCQSKTYYEIEPSDIK